MFCKLDVSVFCFLSVFNFVIIFNVVPAMPWMWIVLCERHTTTTTGFLKI